jgi:solute carrier family 25 phosphate transporter 23/24/25/41
VERLMAGSLAGMTSDSILYPLEVVSTRVTLEKGKYGNFVQAMVQIAKKEGIRGLYAGWGAAMIGVIPYAGISFGCYDILSTQYRKTMNVESAGPLPTLCIGFASGWLASTLSFPMYSATVRLQSGLVPLLADGSKANLVSIMLGTLRTDGWRALFNGWFPATVKIIPQAGTSFVIYEMVKRKLDKANFYDADEDDDLDDN